MGAVSSAARASATESDRPIGSPTDQMVDDVLSYFARRLWPKNTAACVAAEIGKLRGKPCPPRTVERYLGGQRDWSSDGLAVIVAELMRRHGMRNIKVRAADEEGPRREQQRRASHN